MALAGFFVRHQTMGSGNDGDAEAVNDAWQFIGRAVFAQTRLAHAGQLPDDRLARSRVVFQRNFDDAMAALADPVIKFVLQDITLVVEYLGDAFFDAGSRDLHYFVTRHLCIATSGPIICNRIR